MAAAQNPEPAVVELLLDRRADIEARRGGGDTHLHVAAEANQTEVAATLLDRGANANARNTWNRTPLHWAVFSDNSELAKFLFDHGADPNAGFEQNDTPGSTTPSNNSREPALVPTSHMVYAVDCLSRPGPDSDSRRVSVPGDAHA